MVGGSAHLSIASFFKHFEKQRAHVVRGTIRRVPYPKAHPSTTQRHDEISGAVHFYLPFKRRDNRLATICVMRSVNIRKYIVYIEKEREREWAIYLRHLNLTWTACSPLRKAWKMSRLCVMNFVDGLIESDLGLKAPFLLALKSTKYDNRNVTSNFKFI